MKYSVPTVSINLNAVKHNYLNVKKFCKTAETSALVKATSYGLGGENRIVTTLIKSGCKQFFVAHINEGLKLEKNLKTLKLTYLMVVIKMKKKFFTQIILHQLLIRLNS